MPRRSYGTETQAAAMRVLTALLDCATRPHRGLADFSPFMRQRELMSVAFPYKASVSHNLMDDVMTCAALNAARFYDGSYLYYSQRYGYWLADRAVDTEIRTVLGRLRSVNTKCERTLVELSADDNGPIAREGAQQIRLTLDLVYYPLVARLEDMIGTG